MEVLYFEMDTPCRSKPENWQGGGENLALGKRSKAAKVLRAFRKTRRCRSVRSFVQKYGLDKEGFSENMLYHYEEGDTHVPPALVGCLVKVGALQEGDKWHTDLLAAMEYDYELLAMESLPLEETETGQPEEAEKEASVETEGEIPTEPESTHPPDTQPQLAAGAPPPDSRKDGRWRFAVLGIPLIAIAMGASCFLGYKISEWRRARGDSNSGAVARGHTDTPTPSPSPTYTISQAQVLECPATATPYPTCTRCPTCAPYATCTPYPPYTPYPTCARYPTHTPYPT